MPGPYDFVVLSEPFVRAPKARCDSHRPPHPRLTPRDDRETPLASEAGWHERSTNSVKTKGDFWSVPGGSADQFEIADETSRLAQRISSRATHADGRYSTPDAHMPRLDLPDEQRALTCNTTVRTRVRVHQSSCITKDGALPSPLRGGERTAVGVRGRLPGRVTILAAVWPYTAQLAQVFGGRRVLRGRRGGPFSPPPACNRAAIAGCGEGSGVGGNAR